LKIAFLEEGKLRLKHLENYSMEYSNYIHFGNNRGRVVLGQCHNFLTEQGDYKRVRTIMADTKIREMSSEVYLIGASTISTLTSLEIYNKTSKRLAITLNVAEITFIKIRAKVYVHKYEFEIAPNGAVKSSPLAPIKINLLNIFVNCPGLNGAKQFNQKFLNEGIELRF
jgi:hypothetical protein